MLKASDSKKIVVKRKCERLPVDAHSKLESEHAKLNRDHASLRKKPELLVTEHAALERRCVRLTKPSDEFSSEAFPTSCPRRSSGPRPAEEEGQPPPAWWRPSFRAGRGARSVGKGRQARGSISLSESEFVGESQRMRVTGRDCI
jgi:hypothetical protein